MKKFLELIFLETKVLRIDPKKFLELIEKVLRIDFLELLLRVVISGCSFTRKCLRIDCKKFLELNGKVLRIEWKSS